MGLSNVNNLDVVSGPSDLEVGDGLCVETDLPAHGDLTCIASVKDEVCTLQDSDCRMGPAGL